MVKWPEDDSEPSLNDETAMRSLRHEAIEDTELRGIEFVIREIECDDLRLDRLETGLRIVVRRGLKVIAARVQGPARIEQRLHIYRLV
jgi:hypothetical protein